MAYGWSSILVAGLFFMVANERGSGFPTKIQANDYAKKSLTDKEKAHIREVLKLALSELKDEDILQVLSESLVLRYKVCFSPFPLARPSSEVIPGAFGIKEDEDYSPEQKKGLRELLLESLELIDEEEILEFLKSSIDFRIKYCHWSSEFHRAGNPIPQPGLTTTPMTTPAKTASESRAQKTTIVKTTSEVSEAVSPSSVPSSPFTNAPEGEQQAQADVVPADVANALKDVNLENALSSVSELNEKSVSPSMDKPSRSRVVYNDPGAGKQVIRVLKKLNDVANPTEEINLEDALTSRSMLKDMSASSEEKPSRSRVVGNDPAAKLAKPLSKKHDTSPGTNPYSSLAKLASDKNLSDFLVSELNPSVAEKPEHDNDQSAVNPPGMEPDGKVALQTKEHGSEIIEANSDKGEFASVTRIDYNELAHDREKPGVVGVDMGLIVEPNEELSL